MRKIAQDVTSFGKGIEKPNTASSKLLNKKRISYILIVQNDHLKKEAGKMTHVSNKMVRGIQNPLDRMELNEK